MAKTNFRLLWKSNKSAIALAVALFALIATQGAILYVRSEQLMQGQLKERLKTAASLASKQFTGEEVDAIHGPQNAKSRLFIDMVGRLNTIRDAVDDLSFTYIMRRTDKPMMLEFVADADSLKSEAELDTNKNGTVDSDEEPSFPGDAYDISEVVALQHDAFQGPTVDEQITIDQWGKLISGYAPIYRKDGTVAGIVGLDMDAEDFVTLSRRAFSPLLLSFFIIFGSVIAALAGFFVWRRRMESMRTLENERQSLLELVSHQLGAPLATIRWWVELVQEDSCTCKEAHERIEVAAERMNGILRALREADHTTHSDDPLKREPASMSAIAREAIKLVLEEHPEWEERLTADLPMDCTVQMNPRLIRGVVVELLENAFIYSGKTAAVRLGLVCKGGKVTMTVSDDGPGIDPKDHSRIFNRMVRGEKARLIKSDGNGLGLYLCKTIIERAGGSMGFRSPHGEGASFYFSLPVA